MVLAGGLLLGAYEVQGATMPGWLFNFIVIAGIIVLILGSVAFLASRVVMPAVEYGRRWSLRWPVVERDRPDPNQWLLDIARNDANSPVNHLMLLEAKISNKNLDPGEYRPWIELGFTLYNGGVHDILVGPARGHMTFSGKELPEPVESSAHSRKPRGHEHVFKVKQVLPKEIADQAFTELRERGAICSLGVSGVRVKVESKAENGETVEWSLRGDRFGHD